MYHQDTLLDDAVSIAHVQYTIIYMYVGIATIIGESMYVTKAIGL